MSPGHDDDDDDEEEGDHVISKLWSIRRPNHGNSPRICFCYLWENTGRMILQLEGFYYFF